MAGNKDTKNYQKTQSRTASKTKKTIGSINQSIKYLVINPLAVNYKISQSFTADGEVNAKQSYSY